MRNRELRLLALAVAGLALVFAARAGDGTRDSVTTRDPSAVADVAVSDGGGASGGDADGSDGLADQLGRVTSDRSIRLVDFGEVEQSPDLCAEGVRDGTDAAGRPIELSGGQSGVIDEGTFSQLIVDEDVAYGDISGDGFDEAVIHTVCEFGASGRQHEVQVWDTGGGVAEPVGTVPDPPADLTGPLSPDVKGFEVRDGVLAVTWSSYAEDDPNCCPSGEVTLRYELLDGDVVERS